jgi:hypothetical protein
MSNERSGESEFYQALDSVFEELRGEEAAMLHLPEENARLRARLERLQEGQGRFRNAARRRHVADECFLPEALKPPFALRPSRSPERRRRDVLALLVLGAVALALQWRYVGAGTPWLFALLAVISAIRLRQAWSSTSWFFSLQGIEVWQPSNAERYSALIRYSQMLDVEARVTSAQRRRGVGTVAVRYRPDRGPAERTMTIENISEPERLAKWLRTLCESPRP